MEVLPASGGSSSPFGVSAQRLRAGKIAVLICDLDVTGGGAEVNVFGKKARMTGGPAALAVHTGAALMPVTLWFEGDDWACMSTRRSRAGRGGQEAEDRRDDAGGRPRFRGRDQG